MAKIAILILAHKNKQMLDTLTAHLSSDFDVYVHVDKRFDYVPISKENIFAIKSRYKSDWGSYRQILATIALFREAHKKRYDRYVLISGQDIPIRTNREIREFFETNQETDYFAYYQRQDPYERRNDFFKLSLFWLNGNRIHYRNRARNLVKRISNRLLHILESVIQKTQKTFRWYRKVPAEIYCGENWINLTGKTMDRLIEYLDGDKRILNAYKFTKCADEMIVQMIVLNHISPKSVENTSLRFVDFTTGPEDPRIMRIEDLDRICASNSLFARKFDPLIDSAIIEKMYARIREHNRKEKSNT